mmetsp:Transcript_42783/g.114871  ORF Transcript_42783/g.114871 Transcript_42783/m.114871 type:complete len:264 (-) Transcript_42783:8-799(-)
MGERVGVELHSVDKVNGRLVHVLVIHVESHRVPNELLVGSGFTLIIVGHIEQEVAESTLFEQGHKARRQHFRAGDRDFAYCALLDHVAPFDGLEVKIAGGFRVQQDLDQVAMCHDELRDEVHVEIAVGRWARRAANVGKEVGLRRLAVHELLVQVRQVERRRLAAVVTVAINYKHLHTHDREKARQQALSEAGAHDYNLVFSISHGYASLRHPRKVRWSLLLRSGIAVSSASGGLIGARDRGSIFHSGHRSSKLCEKRRWSRL